MSLFIGSEIYRGSTYGAQHPLAIPRVSTVIDLCRALGWLSPDRYRTSPRAKPAALRAFHTPDYIKALQQAETDQAVSDDTRTRHGLGTLSNPVFSEMYRRPATAAGGSLLATDLLVHGGVVHNPGGGTHHGMPDRAAGFCYLNDAALAITAFLAQGLTRIVYVDIDAHHGDGVEAGFADDARVTMVSVHEARRWPFTGALTDRGIGNVFNLPVARGLGDDGFALIRDTLILPVVQAARPEAVILQCGADAVTEDPLSRLDLSNRSHWSVAAALKQMTPRLLVLGGGGYNPWSVARLWSGVWATLSNQDIPDHLPPAAEQILRQLSWSRRAGRTPPEHWFTTLRDPPRPAEISPDLRQDLKDLTARLSPVL